MELKGKKMYVFKTDILNKRVHLSDENQVVTDIDLEAFKKLKVLTVPEIEIC